ncbi:hypothetical protein D3C79_1085500 [compost metagenome]
MAQPLHALAQALLAEFAVVVEGLAAMRHRNLRRNHFHLDVRQHGAQMGGAADAGEMTVGGRADRHQLASIGL